MGPPYPLRAVGCAPGHMRGRGVHPWFWVFGGSLVVSGFWFLVSGFCCFVLPFPGFWFLVVLWWFLVSGFWFLFFLPFPGFFLPFPGFGFLVVLWWFLVSGFWFLVFVWFLNTISPEGHTRPRRGRARGPHQPP